MHTTLWSKMMSVVRAEQESLSLIPDKRKLVVTLLAGWNQPVDFVPGASKRATAQHFAHVRIRERTLCISSRVQMMSSARLSKPDGDNCVRIWRRVY